MRSRRAVSALVGTIMMVALVIPLSFAVWAFANSAVGQTVNAQAERVSSDINTLSEKIVLVNMAFSPTNEEVTLYVYNNGLLDTEITAVICDLCSPSSITSAQISSITSAGIPLPPTLPATVQKGKFVTITFNRCDPTPCVSPLTPISDQTVHVKVVAKYGTASAYFQKAP